MKILNKILDNVEEVILVFLLAVIVVVMFVQVIMRYIVGGGFIWAEEFCRYIFVFSVFLSCGYVVKRNCMFRMTFIQERLPLKMKFALELIVDVVLIAFFLYWAYCGRSIISDSLRTNVLSTALRWPLAIIYIVMFVGMILGAARSLEKLIRDMRAGPAAMAAPEEKEAVEE